LAINIKVSGRDLWRIAVFNAREELRDLMLVLIAVTDICEEPLDPMPPIAGLPSVLCQMASARPVELFARAVSRHANLFAVVELCAKHWCAQSVTYRLYLLNRSSLITSPGRRHVSLLPCPSEMGTRSMMATTCGRKACGATVIARMCASTIVLAMRSARSGDAGGRPMIFSCHGLNEDPEIY
jgi:hypothetical protein